MTQKKEALSDSMRVLLREPLYLFSSVVMIIVLSLFCPRFINYIRYNQININVSVRDFEAPDYQVDQAPANDVYLDGLIQELVDTEFDFSGRFNSREVEDIISSSPGIQKLIGNKRFESIGDLLNYLSANRYPQYEDEVIKNSYLLDSYHAKQVVDYLSNRYLSSIRPCIINGQYERASALADALFLKLDNIDIPPYGSSINWEASKIILLKCLLENPKVLYANQKAVLKFFDILDQHFDIKHIGTLESMIIDDDDELLHIKLYWKAVYDFREKKFDSALKYVESIIDDCDIFTLRDISKLMKARILLDQLLSKHVNSNIPTIEKEDCIKLLVSLRESIFKLSYKSDITYYINEIKNIEPEYFLNESE